MHVSLMHVFAFFAELMKTCFFKEKNLIFLTMNDQNEIFETFLVISIIALHDQIDNRLLFLFGNF